MHSLQDETPARKRPAALASLHRQGAHLVLVGEDKRPVWRGWNRRRPPLDLTLAHDRDGQPVALVPYSVRLSALDVDLGDTAELVEAWPPLTRLDSQRTAGKHLYYDDDEPRGNARFAAFGCEGEIRSAKGYLILWRDAPQRLDTALRSPASALRMFPANDLFAAAGVAAPYEAAPAAAERGGGAAVLPHPAVASPRDWRLETVQPGERHAALFDTVRFWAYAQHQGDDLDAWQARVLAFTRASFRRLPEPDTDAEARKLAYSVASWVWARGGYHGHLPTRQARRGRKSGKVRRAKTAERDAAIVRAWMDGASLREIARDHGLQSHVTVRKIVLRDGPESRQGVHRTKLNDRSGPLVLL